MVRASGYRTTELSKMHFVKLTMLMLKNASLHFLRPRRRSKAIRKRGLKISQEQTEWAGL